MINEKDPKHLEMKRKIRSIGKTLLVIGIIFEVIGLGSFFSAFGSFSGPSPLFGLTFLGMPLIFVGVILTIYGYAGDVARYTANEVAPVTKDVVNYMVDGTKDSLKTVVNTISDGIRGTSTSTTSPKKTVKCRSCNAENDEEAKFCDNCGKPILTHKVCSQCQSKNDLEAVYCNKCGSRFL